MLSRHVQNLAMVLSSNKGIKTLIKIVALGRPNV